MASILLPDIPGWYDAERLARLLLLGNVPVRSDAERLGRLRRLGDISVRSGKRASASRNRAMALFAHFFTSLQDTTDRLALKDRLSKADEQLLARYCVVLAFFEQTFRALVNTPINRGLADKMVSGVEDLLGLATPATVRDICEMSRAFYDSQQELLQRTPIVLNPTFAGSGDVGGADADLIAAHSLIEFKSSKAALLRSRDIFQLLGYACLDYANEYDIRQFGVYLARRAALYEWPADDLVLELSAGACDFGRFRTEATEFIRSRLAPRIAALGEPSSPRSPLSPRGRGG